MDLEDFVFEVLVPIICLVIALCAAIIAVGGTYMFIKGVVM